MEIARIWIDEGCICCQACTSILPEVFMFVDAQAMVVGAVREDGVTDRNDPGRSPFTLVARAAYGDRFEEAVAGCPIEIIHAE